MILSICDMPETLSVLRIIQIVITIIKVVVPILLIVSAMIELVRAVTNSELNKISKPIVNKIIAAILIFLIPTFVRIIANVAGNNGEYENCLGNITLETISSAYNKQAESLVSKAEETNSITDYNNAMAYLINLKDKDAKNSYLERLKVVKDKIDEKNNPSKPGGGGGNDVQDDGVLKIYYLGIGRYDGHLIIGNNSVLFIDGGFVSQGNKAISFIKSLGITKINGLIGSHMHDNHIDAHRAFVQELEIERVYYGEDPSECLSKKTCVKKNSNPTKLMQLIKEKNIPMTILTPGKDIKIGNLTFDIVAPKSLKTGSGYPENNNSLNMILKFKNHKFYFSGDHIRSSEILSSYDASTLDVDILKWPHHGEERVANSFLDVLTPSYVIAPASGLKDPVKDGASHCKAKVYYTGNDGYVLAESDGTNLSVSKVSKR